MIHKKMKNDNHDNNNENDINSSYFNKSDKVPLVYLHNYENVIQPKREVKISRPLLSGTYGVGYDEVKQSKQS